ncbi:MAG: hypothetical protein NZ990_07775 [Myxococcota bacterium]|nr:hypothetical protein [Myxococcota bacterium]
MTSALSITRSVSPPRAAFVDFPLGHTTGKKNQPEMQRNLLRAALEAFLELGRPGEIKSLGLRWSEDEGWRENPMARSSSGPSDAEGDFRTPRRDIPQYQLPADQEEAENNHRDGACGSCIGAE